MIRYLSVNWTLPGQFWRCCRAQRLPLRFQHTTLTLPKHLFVVKTSWLCNWCPNLPSACLWWVQSQLWTHTHTLKKPSGLSYELSVTSDLMDLTAAQFFFLLYTHTQKPKHMHSAAPPPNADRIAAQHTNIAEKNPWQVSWHQHPYVISSTLLKIKVLQKVLQAMP